MTEFQIFLTRSWVFGFGSLFFFGVDILIISPNTYNPTPKTQHPTPQSLTHQINNLPRYNNHFFRCVSV